MTCMFQSKRMLLGNYYTFQDRQMKIQRSENEQDLLLYDEERKINILCLKITMVLILCLLMISV